MSDEKSKTHAKVRFCGACTNLTDVTIKLTDATHCEKCGVLLEELDSQGGLTFIRFEGGRVMTFNSYDEWPNEIDEVP
jgi:hypothetical protein